MAASEVQQESTSDRTRWLRHLAWAALTVAAVVPWLGRAAAPVPLVSFSGGTVADGSSVNANFTALSAALAAQERFTPLEQIYLGGLPNTATTAAVYDLSAQVPADATEVLVYVRAYTGSTSPTGAREFRLHTVDETDATRLYAKYFHVFAYGQAAVPFSSANVWLPVTAERKLHVTRIAGSPITGSFGNAVYVVGYR